MIILLIACTLLLCSLYINPPSEPRDERAEPISIKFYEFENLMELYLLNPTQQDMDGLIRHFEGTPLADNLNTWVEENPSWMDREVPCKYLPRSYPSRQEIRMGEFILQIYLRDDCEDLETLTDMYSGTQIGPLIEKGTYYIRKAEETRKEYLSLIEQKLAGLDLESYSLRKLVDLCAQLR